ncbi:MAG: hypothetical protein ABTQ73_09510 [Caldilineales bacterium]
MSTTRNRTQEIIPLVASGSALLLELVFIPVVRLLPEYPGILVMQLMLVLIVVLAFAEFCWERRNSRLADQNSQLLGSWQERWLWA